MECGPLLCRVLFLFSLNHSPTKICDCVSLSITNEVKCWEDCNGNGECDEEKSGMTSIEFLILVLLYTPFYNLFLYICFSIIHVI